MNLGPTLAAELPTARFATHTDNSERYTQRHMHARHAKYTIVGTVDNFSGRTQEIWERVNMGRYKHTVYGVRRRSSMA